MLSNMFVTLNCHRVGWWLVYVGIPYRPMNMKRNHGEYHQTFCFSSEFKNDHYYNMDDDIEWISSNVMNMYIYIYL